MVLTQHPVRHFLTMRTRAPDTEANLPEIGVNVAVQDRGDTEEGRVVRSPWYSQFKCESFYFLRDSRVNLAFRYIHKGS